MHAAKPRKIKNIKNILGGFHDVASFREETKAPPAEISDAEIVLLIESDKAHLAAHRHKQQSAELYVENAKLRHLAGLPPKVIKVPTMSSTVPSTRPTSPNRQTQRKLIRPDTPRYPVATKPTITKPTTAKPNTAKTTKATPTTTKPITANIANKNAFSPAHWLNQITSPVKPAGNKPMIDQLIKDAQTPLRLPNTPQRRKK
jgi:hypothetical protein